MYKVVINPILRLKKFNDCKSKVSSQETLQDPQLGLHPASPWLGSSVEPQQSSKEQGQSFVPAGPKRCVNTHMQMDRYHIH